MYRKLLYWLSFIWPWPIYIGQGTTIDESATESELQRTYREKFGRRINRTTAKFNMQSEYALYDLVNITKDPETQVTTYHLEHCATGQTLSVTQEVFKLLFTHVEN